VNHLHRLAELADRVGSVEDARDEYLACLDADDGLAVLTIPAEAIAAAAEARRSRAAARCGRCGARLPAKRRRCSRCGLSTR
jgi:hypothetical protein